MHDIFGYCDERRTRCIKPAGHTMKAKKKIVKREKLKATRLRASNRHDEEKQRSKKRLKISKGIKNEWPMTFFLMLRAASASRSLPIMPRCGRKESGQHPGAALALNLARANYKGKSEKLA